MVMVFVCLQGFSPVKRGCKKGKEAVSPVPRTSEKFWQQKIEENKEGKEGTMFWSSFEWKPVSSSALVHPTSVG